MTKLDELIVRLRDHQPISYGCRDCFGATMDEAADTITSLRADNAKLQAEWANAVNAFGRTSADNARLREALEPFAKQIELIECTTDHAVNDDDKWDLADSAVVTIRDLRRARTALAQEGA